jgi:hypothetical protein
MPTISTQTTEIYTVIESDEISIMNNLRIFTSKYTDEIIYIFFKRNRSNSNDKNTMTSYNSKNNEFMDMYIDQLKSAGDY